MKNMPVGWYCSEYHKGVVSSEYEFYFGIDLSLVSTGFSVVNSHGLLVDSGIIKTRTGLSVKRINYITSEIKKKLVNGSFLVVIEKPFGVIGSGKILLELNGVVKNMVYGLNQAVIQVSQKSLKKIATNNGNAKKEMMLKSANDECGIDLKKHDVADAFWLSMFGYWLVNGVDEKFRASVIKNYLKNASI